jgi:hypothetical protein
VKRNSSERREFNPNNKVCTYKDKEGRGNFLTEL